MSHRESRFSGPGAPLPEAPWDGACRWCRTIWLQGRPLNPSASQDPKWHWWAPPVVRSYAGWQGSRGMAAWRGTRGAHPRGSPGHLRVCTWGWRTVKPLMGQVSQPAESILSIFKGHGAQRNSFFLSRWAPLPICGRSSQIIAWIKGVFHNMARGSQIGWRKK